MKYDLVILGGGAAGFSAAIRANELEAEALLVNNSAVGIGGTCVNVGCLPTKHLLHVAEVIHRAKKLCPSFSFSFREIIEEKDRVIEKLREEKYGRVLKELSHVDFIEGNARFLGNGEVEVEGEVFKGKSFVVATGSSPSVPSIKGIGEVDFLTNTEALSLKELPESMIIMGGGALGIEFAQIFSRLGTEVTLLQRGERILKREEPELAELLQGYLKEEGIQVFTGAQVRDVSRMGKSKVVRASIGGKERSFEAEQLLLATGRKPNTQNLGLEKLGVRLGKRGEVIVDEHMRAGELTFAAGDVTGEPMLETVAAREGMVAAHNALAEEKIKMDYRITPHAVFTSPALAGVGLTDEQAVKMGIKCRCNLVPMKLVPKAQAIGDTRGAIKMVVDTATQEVIGVHILSANAADLIHEAVMILKGRMSVDDVINTLHVFPTLSEGIKLAAQSFRRDITRMSCCVE